MKIYVYVLFAFCFFNLTNSLNAQNVDGEIVYIKGYKNAKNKKVAKKPIKAEIILDLPNITLYRVFSSSSLTTGGGTGTYNYVDVSDTFWFCKRPNEEIASIISWTFNTQVNKNTIFKKNASEYFKDYPELSQQIKNKDFKHDDIVAVVTQYNVWKSDN